MELPESFDPEMLRTVAIVVLVVLVLLVFLVLRFIQKMVLRVILIGALAGLGLFVYAQRDDLEECVPNCACSFLGFEVNKAGIDPRCPAAES